MAGTIYQNSPTVFYTGTNNNENWLPAMNSLILDASASNLSGWQSLVSFNSTPVGDARITTFELYSSAPPSTVSGNNYPNRIYKYKNSSNIQYGIVYDFRVAYKNNTVIDASNVINYAYTSTSFGAFGPSNPPASITFNSTDFNNLTLSGVGATTIDASLNFPWTSAPPPNVGYGATFSAQKNPTAFPNNFKQIGGHDNSYNKIDFSYNIPHGPDTTTQNWGPKIGTLVPQSEYYYSIDISGSDSTYYQEVLTGSFGPTYAPQDISSQILLPIPERTISNYPFGYTNALGTNGGVSMTSVGESATGGGSSSLNVSARSRPGYIPLVVDFIDTLTTLTYIYNGSSAGQFKYLANWGDRVNPAILGASPVTSGSLIGNDSSGVPITNFETQIRLTATNPYANISDVSSQYQYGWVGDAQDAPRTINTGPFNLTTSAVKDIDSTNLNTVGYYLGVDVSNIKLDVSLNSFIDVSNNNYTNYRWRVLQNLKRATPHPDISGFVYYDFYIGKLPLQDILLNNLTITTGVPTLPLANYFGLQRPEIKSGSPDNRPSVTIDCSLVNLNPDWAPPSAQNTLIEFNFYIDPTDIINDQLLDTTTKTWTGAVPNKETTYSFSETYHITYDAGAGDYKYVPYSRALGASPQFGSKTTGNIYSNNVTRTPTTNSYWQNSNNADISFNNLPLWWDFVWNDTSDLRDTRISYGSNPTGSLFSVTGGSIDVSLNNAGVGMNPAVGGAGDPWLSYDHITLPNNQLMISSGQIMSGNNSNISTTLNPYINYNVSYYGTLGDYSPLDTSGDVVSWSYGANIFYSNTLTPVTSGTIKWFVIYIDNPATLNANNNSHLEIKDGNTTLTLGTDYILFYMEKDYNNLSSAYTVNGVGRSYTPWVDCANKSVTTTNIRDFTTAQGLTPIGTGNGAYDTTNSNFPIKKFGGTNRVRQYYRIGLFNSGNIKITQIILTYAP